jgi:hypothetical protein
LVAPELLYAVPNSTIVALNKHLSGPIHGREGSLQLDVYATNMLPVPDVRHANDAVTGRLQDTLASVRRRGSLPLVDVDGIGDEWSGELAMMDRQELDDAS